ncbi:hypothetical protein [Aquimarina atlantica]|uniref:hypothetical protein n=1 Tax=Aquimarina atlantica TaxID=1317122 RepID=UPI000A6502FC|nr:hypothetical protein [Aquimarina atlantica]
MITNRLKTFLILIGIMVLTVFTFSCETDQDETYEIQQIQPDPGDDAGGEDPECPSCWI